MTSSSWVLDQLEVGSSVGPSCDLMGLILGLPSWMIGGATASPCRETITLSDY